MSAQSVDPEVSRPASQPRHEVGVLFDVRISASDGLELSANLWLPRPLADEPEQTFPAILEMIPYRKDDWRLASDMARGEWLAARGFAFCRLDIRGTGSSPGIATDEYTPRETQDGYDAVEWLAAQPWCNGNVGMWGISYGGFTSIQVAMLRPPHLKAIVPGDGDGRPLHGRRPLHRRLRDRVGAEPVRGQHGRHERDAAQGRVPRRGVGRRVARAARADAGVAVRVAPPAARRPVLAAGLAGTRLRRDRGGDLLDRRLDGRVRRSRAADAGALHRAATVAHRELGPLAAGRRLPRPEPRLAPRDGPVLRSLAQGHRQRRDGRAGGRAVPPRLRRSGAVSCDLAGRVARSAVLAAGRRRGTGPAPRSGSAAARRRPG